jgi:hypothetical protein
MTLDELFCLIENALFSHPDFDFDFDFIFSLIFGPRFLGPFRFSFVD